MNEQTSILMNVIYDSDTIFLSAIEADDPSELEETITKYKHNMHQDMYDVSVENIQWKKIYDELKSIDDPVDFIDRSRDERDEEDDEMFSELTRK